MVVAHNYTGKRHHCLNGTNVNAKTDWFEVVANIGKDSIVLDDFDTLPAANGYFQSLLASECVDMTTKALFTHKAGRLAKNQKALAKMSLTLRRITLHGEQVMAKNSNRVLKISYNGPKITKEIKSRPIHGYASEGYADMIKNTLDYTP